MARILRGEVRWADLNPVRGHEQSGTVIAVALTTQPQKAGFPLTVERPTPVIVSFRHKGLAERSDRMRGPSAAHMPKLRRMLAAPDAATAPAARKHP